MEPEFWLERWRRGETGWHLDEVNRHLTELWPRLGLSTDTRVFVPLCGKTLDLLWLASRSHRVLGVELSRLAVESLFADNGLTPTVAEEPSFMRFRVDELEVLCGDFFDLAPGHLAGVGAVYDRASLIALPPGQRARYAAHLDRVLPDTVPRLLITLEYDQSRMDGPPFSVHPEEVQSLFGVRHRITELAGFDVLDESARFRARGLEGLRERVYRLDPT
jgi:thiopurine S-methyltransferase